MFFTSFVTIYVTSFVTLCRGNFFQLMPLTAICEVYEVWFCLMVCSAFLLAYQCLLVMISHKSSVIKNADRSELLTVSSCWESTTAGETKQYWNQPKPGIGFALIFRPSWWIEIILFQVFCKDKPAILSSALGFVLSTAETKVYWRKLSLEFFQQLISFHKLSIYYHFYNHDREDASFWTLKRQSN